MDNTKKPDDIYSDAVRKYLQGDFRGGLEELAVAEEHTRASGDVILLSIILIQKAGMLRDLGRIDEGVKLLEEVENQFAQLPRETPVPAQRLVLIALRLEQGIVERDHGQFSEADRYLREAETEARNEQSGFLILSDVLANLATLYLCQGKLEEAQTKLSEAVEIDRKYNIYGRLANDLNLLGILYSQMGDHATAALYWEEALEEARSTGFVKRAADALSHLAEVLEQAGRLDEAETAFTVIGSLYQEIGDIREVANNKTSLAIIAARKGDLTRARDIFGEAQQLHHQTGQIAGVVRDLLNLSNLESQAGQVQSAYTYALQAATEAEKYSLLDIMWLALSTVANTRAACLRAELEDQQDVEHSVEVMKNELLPLYTKAADAIELLRTGIGRPEEREYLLWDKEELYGTAIYLASTLKQASAAFTFSERAHARAFLDVMGAPRLERTAIRHPLAQRRRQLTEEIFALSKTDDTSAQAHNLMNELRLLRAQINADAPAIAAVTEAQMPDLQAICNALPKKTALIEFFILNGSLLCTFVLNSKGVARLTINSLGQIDLAAKVAQFRAELEYEVEGIPTGRELFGLLFLSVWDAVEPVDRLLIVPHKELHHLPFGALWFNNVGQGPKQLHLSQRFYHSVLPSAAFLPLCLQLSRSSFKRGRARVLGNPTGDLPFSEEEAKAVASHLGVNPLIGKEATRTALIEAPRNLSVIHVASHGEYNEVDPLLSGVVLADGRVTVDDLLETNISTGLLTLSGCVTGLAERRPGDELIGLARAAALSGIPSIVTTLWTVRDKSTNLFFDYFYRDLIKYGSKEHALLAAQQALIATKEFSHPLHWAPFILMGDWR
jgi:CHAT domain-containing protein